MKRRKRQSDKKSPPDSRLYSISSVQTDGYSCLILLERGKVPRKYEKKEHVIRTALTPQQRQQMAQAKLIIEEDLKAVFKTKPLDSRVRDFWTLFCVADLNVIQNREYIKIQKFKNNHVSPESTKTDDPVAFNSGCDEEIVASFSTKKYHSANINRMWLKIASVGETSILTNGLLEHYVKNCGGILRKLIAHNKGDSFLNIDTNLLATPSSQTANYDEYVKYIEYSSKHFLTFLDFSMFNSSRKLRFNRYVAKQQVIYLFLFLLSFNFNTMLKGF